ncbi:MAG TPA: polysaccharide deacetylase family protein [Phycisphaerae bacterium]|nr:polysaccharide deacetylase family protein [Phycisphaerae bacterium]
MTWQSDNRLPGSERAAGNRSPNKAAILLYHRVVELPSDPQVLCVTPSHFAEHLELLRKKFNVMSLVQLIRAMDNGVIPPRSVVLTFDDGYADNLNNAKPMLDGHGIAATVFVSGGSLGSKRELWWDDLERLLLQPTALPRTLHQIVGGRPYEWCLGDTAACDAGALQRSRGWNVLDKADPTPRHEAYRALCTLLRPLRAAQQRRILNGISKWAGVRAEGRPTHRCLTAAELRQLADGGRIDVGSHTLTHPVLSALPASKQRDEVRKSKEKLETILGLPVTSFSYPYGQRSDYSAATVDFVRGAGFACACSNFFGFVRADSDRFQLPRMIVRDWDGEAFAQRLSQWWSHG